jgi:RND family efflux transporter MFP subunit
MYQGKTHLLIGGWLFAAGVGLALSQEQTPSQTADAVAVANPALNVRVVKPEQASLSIELQANGSIAAWQEAVIGAEIGDLRLSAVAVQVGEQVKKGQVLATFADDSVQTDVAQSKAGLAEAQANLAEARANAERARKTAESGALSAQQLDQYLTAEKTAAAKLQSAKAQLDAQLLRLKYTKVTASDDGVISARSATLGAVAAKGQELFRLIRQNRLEWRAEVTAAQMTQLQTGVIASVEVPNVGKVDGKVRALAPTLDVQSRNGLVYVDLPNAMQHGLRAGMFGNGVFHLGDSRALTIPQAALSLKEGFSYVFRIGTQNGERAKVQQLKVQIGRRSGERVEVVAGLNADDRLVADGAAFLSDGDVVRVVEP